MSDPHRAQPFPGAEQGVDPLLGRVIDGRYTILSMLGKGGMGAVYRAHQASLERSVALKVLVTSPERARDVEFQRRFFLEAATAAKLKHHNTITIFDYGSDDVASQRVFFIAMELIEGKTLSRAMKTEPFTPLRSVQIALQVCRSTREAHRNGVVHRDLKPGNIMLLRQVDDDDSDRDFVKVLDFGLAKPFFDAGEGDPNLTRAGTFLGSPRYVAPEQIEGKKVDPRADIYSLGCVLYRMLAGRVPFDGEAPLEVMLKHMNDPVPPLLTDGVPPALERLVEDCLAKSRDQRPSSMDEVINRLKFIRASLDEGYPQVVSISDEHRHPRDSTSMPRAPSLVPRTSSSSSMSAAPSSSMSAGSSSMSAAPSSSSSSHSRSDESARLFESQPTPLGVGDVAINEAPPQKVFGRRSVPVRSRGVFTVGLIFGVLGCVFAVVMLDDDIRARVTEAWNRTGAAPVPPVDPKPAPEVKTHRARIRVTTTPPRAQLFEVKDQGPLTLLGDAPLTLDWRLTTDDARVILVRAPQHADARAEVKLPTGENSDPVIIDLDVKLSRLR